MMRNQKTLFLMLVVLTVFVLSGCLKYQVDPSTEETSPSNCESQIEKRTLDSRACLHDACIKKALARESGFRGQGLTIMANFTWSSERSRDSELSFYVWDNFSKKNSNDNLCRLMPHHIEVKLSWDDLAEPTEHTMKLHVPRKSICGICSVSGQSPLQLVFDAVGNESLPSGRYATEVQLPSNQLVGVSKTFFWEYRVLYKPA